MTFHDAPAFPDLPPAFDARPDVRFLRADDLPELVALERRKWDEGQAAPADELLARIRRHPDLCVGAFCPWSGRALASLFMRPVASDFWRSARCWADGLAAPVPVRTYSLFGISLSSSSGEAVDALLRFFWPRALRAGWRHIFLGSPVPGLSAWRRRHPLAPLEDYVHARRGGLPLDPQLRYYHGRGFDEIVAVKPGYFPHARSLDVGVVLRGTIPLSALSPLWRALPLSTTARMTRRLEAML